MNPPLLTYPNKFIRGMFGLHNGQAVDRDLQPLALGYYWQDGLEGLRYSYPTDAHCVGYYIEGQPFAPRLTKGSLKNVPGVMLGWALVDVDNPNHTPWDLAFSGLLEQIETARATIGECGWYATRSGYRLFWPLAQPIPIAQAKPLLVGILERLRAKGINADQRCVDWTRFFRLPFVVRDGQTQQLPNNLGDL